MVETRDESGNGKIPYRPTLYPDFPDRMPYFRKKNEIMKKFGKIRRNRDRNREEVFPDRISGSRFFHGILPRYSRISAHLHPVHATTGPRPTRPPPPPSPPNPKREPRAWIESIPPLHAAQPCTSCLQAHTPIAPSPPLHTAQAQQQCSTPAGSPALWPRTRRRRPLPPIRTLAVVHSPLRRVAVDAGPPLSPPPHPLHRRLLPPTRHGSSPWIRRGP